MLIYLGVTFAWLMLDLFTNRIRFHWWHVVFVVESFIAYAIFNCIYTVYTGTPIYPVCRMCNNDLVLSSTFDCDRSVCLRAQVLDWKADHIVKTILYLLAFGALLVGGFAIGLCSTTRFCCAAAVSAELHL